MFMHYSLYPYWRLKMFHFMKLLHYDHILWKVSNDSDSALMWKNPFAKILTRLTVGRHLYSKRSYLIDSLIQCSIKVIENPNEESWRELNLAQNVKSTCNIVETFLNAWIRSGTGDNSSSIHVLGKNNSFSKRLEIDLWYKIKVHHKNEFLSY